MPISGLSGEEIWGLGPLLWLMFYHLLPIGFYVRTCVREGRGNRRQRLRGSIVRMRRAVVDNVLEDEVGRDNRVL